MSESFKRYVSRCAILMFLLAIEIIIGFKNNLYMEVSGTVENIEYDEVGEREPEILEVLEDSENINVMEIYESILKDESGVEWEGQQVRISELFWDNNIEYCFFDIDGDGMEELHVRDNAAYYAVKVLNETPRIIFEGWWHYEPVITDKLCGILRHFNGYGSEKIEFIKISADGSMKSDGLFYWSDGNKNGIIDEEDTFMGPGDIGMEQYVQYREGHAVKQSENELEWTNRQLKDYVTWQEAYIDFIEKIHLTVSSLNEFDYSLIYVDDDDIPELFIYTGGMATGEIIVSFYDGNIGTMQRERCGIKYMEHGGMLYNRNGAMGFYPCDVYMLEKGKFSEIGTGWYSECGDGQGNIYNDYYWEGSAVTETEYEAYIEELIDTSKCVEPSLLYSEDEILEILMDRYACQRLKFHPA